MMMKMSIYLYLTSFVTSSSTILLSLGDLPVLSPDEADKAPVSVIVVLYMLGSVEPRCSFKSAYS